MKLLGVSSITTPMHTSRASTRVQGCSGLHAETLPADRTTLILGRLEDPLPEGPFDLVVSALAVHHVEGEGKADLFRRIVRVLAPGGRFVLADVVEPVNPKYVPTKIDPEVDHPSKLAENIAWLKSAGLFPRSPTPTGISL